MSKMLWVVAVFLALFAAGTASAQRVAVDLSPVVGVFLPTADVFDWSDTQDGVTASLSGKHQTGILFGGRLTLWFSDAFGLEGGIAYGPSDVGYDVSVEGVGLVETASKGVSASVWRANLKGMLNLVPSPDAAVDFYVGGGLAIVGRGGDAYRQFDMNILGDVVPFENEGTTDVGGVLNVGVAFDVSESIAIRIDVEDYIHSLKQTVTVVDGEILESDSMLQNDLLLTGGIAIHLGR